MIEELKHIIFTIGRYQVLSNSHASVLYSVNYPLHDLEYGDYVQIGAKSFLYYSDEVLLFKSCTPVL